jgi:hypothetical protein
MGGGEGGGGGGGYSVHNGGVSDCTVVHNVGKGTGSGCTRRQEGKKARIGDSHSRDSRKKWMGGYVREREQLFLIF